MDDPRPSETGVQAGQGQAPARGPLHINGWRVAYRTEFPERAKTGKVIKQLKARAKVFAAHKLIKKLKPASRHRPIEEQMKWQTTKLAAAKREALVFKLALAAVKGAKPA